jgi:dTDP-4-amino-4,6-dideoxygalactose transaminase
MKWSSRIMSIPFNKSIATPNTGIYIKQALDRRTSGDGDFTKKCSGWFEERFGTARALLTTSCTHALEMAAFLCGIKEDDEVIMSSYTFSSTANAFVLRGASIVFVDIRPDTMNIDETLIEAAITDKTRVIAPMHYAGASCDMDVICEIAKKHNLHIVEDAAQGVMAEYKNKALGTFGDFGCFSFHETKNFSMGEGGALLIRNPEYIETAEIIREKGTNRSSFFRGEIDKYSWVDWGSSYLPSEINAAYLWSQLEIAETIGNARHDIWDKYYHLLSPLAENGLIELPYIPRECRHNAHMFYIKAENDEVQSDLLDFLRNAGIGAVFHYVPLHSSKAGKKFGRFYGEDKFTTKESSRLIRLPLYYGLTSDEIEKVVNAIRLYYKV